MTRCNVKRLMHEIDLRGILRGRKPRTRIPKEVAESPRDLVKFRFRATALNQLRVADLTDVASWNGFAYVPFMADLFSPTVVGLQASRSLRRDRAPDALEQTLHASQTLVASSTSASRTCLRRSSR